MHDRAGFFENIFARKIAKTGQVLGSYIGKFSH